MRGHTYVEVVADGVDLLAGPLAEPVAPHLVQHLIHLPRQAPLLFPAPGIRLELPRIERIRFWIAGIAGEMDGDGKAAAATYWTPIYAFQ